jgi:hypothetical protein
MSKGFILDGVKVGSKKRRWSWWSEWATIGTSTRSSKSGRWRKRGCRELRSPLRLLTRINRGSAIRHFPSCGTLKKCGTLKSSPTLGKLPNSAEPERCGPIVGPAGSAVPQRGLCGTLQGSAPQGSAVPQTGTDSIYILCLAQSGGAQGSPGWLSKRGIFRHVRAQINLGQHERMVDARAFEVLLAGSGSKSPPAASAAPHAARRRPLSKQVPPRRSRSAVAVFDPSPTYGQKDDAAQNTIGIVCVSRLTAAVPGVPLVEGLIRGDCTGSAVAVTMRRRVRDVGGSISIRWRCP